MRKEVGAVILKPGKRQKRARKEHGHGAPDGPALTDVAHRVAEGPAETGRDREDRKALKEVRERRRIFKRMSGVDVEEAAAVRAEHLDCFLACNRSERNAAVLTRYRLEGLCGAPGLNASFADQNERKDEGNGEEEPKIDANHVNPEVAEILCFRARKAANHNEGDGNARTRGNKVLHRKADRLRERGKRSFAAVALPVRVRDEGDGGIERLVGRHACKTHGVPRQHALETQNAVKEEAPQSVEEKERKRIARPALLRVFAEPQALQKHAVEAGNGRRRLAFAHRRHPAAHRLRDERENQEK